VQQPQPPKPRRCPTTSIHYPSMPHPSPHDTAARKGPVGLCRFYARKAAHGREARAKTAHKDHQMTENNESSPPVRQLEAADRETKARRYHKCRLCFRTSQCSLTPPSQTITSTPPSQTITSKTLYTAACTVQAHTEHSSRQACCKKLHMSAARGSTRVPGNTSHAVTLARCLALLDRPITSHATYLCCRPCQHKQ
jgi:hypothetical protein